MNMTTTPSYISVPVNPAAKNPNSGILHEFTEKDLQTLESLIVKEAHPTHYGNQFKSIEFVGFKIIPKKNIVMDNQSPIGSLLFSLRAQTARVGGAISEIEDKELETSMVGYGYRLDVPPPAVFEMSNDEYSKINGMSRGTVTDRLNFKNEIVAVYRRKEGFTDEQVKSDLSLFGIVLNGKNLPAVPAKDYDIQAELVRAINNGWVSRDIKELEERAKPMSDAVGIGKTKRTQIAFNAFNETDTFPILPMTSEKARVWLEHSKYKDIPGKVRYVIKSFDMVTKGLADITRLSTKHPNEEIRVIVHCGIVTGGLDQVIARAQKFWSEWHLNLSYFKSVWFQGAPLNSDSKVVLYGVVPQVTEVMDTSQVCLFDQDGAGEFYQKLNGGIETWGASA